MNLDLKKEQQEKFIRSLYPVSAELMKKKTFTILNVGNFKLHQYFLRFFFSVFSFALYLPTFIDFFNTSTIAADYFKLVLAVCIGAGIEISLAVTARDFYIIKYSKNDISKRLKFLVVFCALLSIIGSSLSGINLVSLTDNSQVTIVDKNQKDKKKEVDMFTEMINKNDNIIKDNIELIKQNNLFIEGLKKVSMTKKGASQISSYIARNKELQGQNDKLMGDNLDIRQQIKEASNFGNKTMTDQLTKAGKRELIYMVVFFISGIMAVFAILFSYDFIAKFHYYMDKEIKEAENEVKNLATSSTNYTFSENDIKKETKNTANTNTDRWSQEIKNFDKKSQNLATTWTDYTFTLYDSLFFEKYDIQENRLYIYQNIRQKFGKPLNASIMLEYGINRFAKELHNQFPEGFRRTEILRVLTLVQAYDNAATTSTN
jgi:hypothetical protein